MKCQNTAENESTESEDPDKNLQKIKQQISLFSRTWTGKAINPVGGAVKRGRDY